MTALRTTIRDYGLYMAWLVAIIATAGSLYFSDVRNFIPCTFCWYQRILMYPLVVLFGIASYRGDKGIITYSLPFSVAGIFIAGYHYLDQKIPSFGPPTACSSGIPCNAAYINWAGFITIPFLALTAFTLITVILVVMLTTSDTLSSKTQDSHSVGAEVATD
jgi:disulfide bond formation protein DsbB